MASMDAIGSIAATSVFPSAVSLDDYVARQHYADLVFGLQGLVGKGQVARAEDSVFSKINIESFLERLLDIDFRKCTNFHGGKRHNEG